MMKRNPLHSTPTIRRVAATNRATLVAARAQADGITLHVERQGYRHLPYRPYETECGQKVSEREIAQSAEEVTCQRCWESVNV